MKNIFLMLMLLLCFCEVTNNSNSDSSNDDFIGIWVFIEYIDGKKLYKKSFDFDSSKPGIEFKSNHAFIKRQNNSFCGTPPITYANYNGTWNALGLDTLQIICEFWGGIDTSEIVLDSVSNDELIITWK